MLVVQGLALYQLFSPFYLRLPNISLPAELDEPEEPIEYEINLDPGPMGPTPKPVERAQPAQSRSERQSERQSNSQPLTAPIEAPPPSASQASASPPDPDQPKPEQAKPDQANPVQASPAQAAAVVSIVHSTPAPQPNLAIEATPAPRVPEIVLVPSVDVAAAATTELPAEERGADSGAPANSDAISMPVRPLALDASAVPDQVAAAPISILPGVQTMTIEPVIAVVPVATADRRIDRVPVDLTVTGEKPVISQIAVPLPGVDVARPMRVQPDAPKPDLRVEQAKLSIDIAKPTVPAAAARPVLSRADAASANPVSAATPDLRVDAVTPDIAQPSAPAAAAARPVLRSAPAKVSAADSVRLEAARGEIGRHTMVVQAPIAVTESADSDASGLDASKVPSTTVSGSSAHVPSADASTAQNSGTQGRGENTSGLPSDPFARAGSGKGPRDFMGQGRDAAAAQVGANAAASNQGGSAFRRYHDPFADDAPNPLAGLRLREPQMFSDVSRFLVKTFGPAALGFAVGASSEIDDFSGPNAGILIEQWIQQHHSDLQRECRVRQETMDEHIRRLLCGEP